MKFGEKLDGIMRFEADLEDYYASIRDQSEFDGVRLLVYFLGRNRRSFESIINEFSVEDLTDMRESELSAPPEIDLENALAISLPAPNEVNSVQLLAFADRIDSLCIDYYKEMMLLNTHDRVDRLLDKFIDFKLSERTTLQKMATVEF